MDAYRRLEFCMVAGRFQLSVVTFISASAIQIVILFQPHTCERESQIWWRTYLRHRSPGCFIGSMSASVQMWHYSIWILWCLNRPLNIWCHPVWLVLGGDGIYWLESLFHSCRQTSRSFVRLLVALSCLKRMAKQLYVWDLVVGASLLPLGVANKDY